MTTKKSTIRRHRKIIPKYVKMQKNTSSAFINDILELKLDISELKKNYSDLCKVLGSLSSSAQDSAIDDYFKMIEDVDIPEISRSKSSSLIRFDVKKKSPF